jgi:hypothetical protein
MAQGHISLSHPGSEEDDEPDSSWDFSGLGNPSAMRDFMTACDYCLSDCFDDSHSLGDEDCGPSHECFHVDLEGLDEGNHLGMPEDDDPSRSAPRVDILRELAMVPVPAGGQDTQLEQIHEMQARLDEEAGQLVQLRQNIGQERAGRAPAGEVCHLTQDVWRRIADDARARLPPASSGAGQNLAAAAMLLHAMPEPSTTEGRCIQGELKNLLEDAVVRWAESSGSRRQGYPPEHRVATSRFMRETSVHTGRTRDTAPVAPGRLGNEHHRRDRQAHLDKRVRRGYHLRRRGYHLRRGGRYDSREDQSPSPKPPGPQDFSRAIRRAPFPTRFRAPTTITKYSEETRPELWLADYRLACQLGGTDDDNLIIRNLPLFLSDAARAWLEHLPPAQISNWDNLVKAFTGNFQGMYVRPWELLGSPMLPPAAGRIPAGLHPAIFEAAHRAALHHRLRCHQRIPRWHHLPRPGEQAGSQDSHQGERADGHRHQVCLWLGGGRGHLPEGQAASGAPAG